MPIQNMLLTLFSFNDNKKATTLLLSEKENVCDFTITSIARESLRSLFKTTVSCDRLQQLILRNNVDKDIASTAVAHYRGKVLTLSGNALGSETARAVMEAVRGNRYIYQLNLQNLKEPVLCIIYDMFAANFIAQRRHHIREVNCNNNAKYDAKFTQCVQNLLRQEITMLINGASAIITYKGKNLFSPLSPARANPTENERDISSFSRGLQKSNIKC